MTICLKKKKIGKLTVLMLFWVLFWGMPFSPVLGAGPSIPLSEYKIKAVYLYKFIQFVRWPKELLAQDTITIGILGEDPFGESFAEVEGKKIIPLNKKLVVQKYGVYHKDCALDCNILYIHASEKEKLKDIFNRLSGKKVLVFADMDGFLEAGGMVRFVKESEKIRWEMNKAAIDTAGIKLNAQIFQLAVRVLR